MHFGKGDLGIVCGGYAFTKLVDYLGERLLTNRFMSTFRVVKITTLYPFPADHMRTFLAGAKSVLVLEDNEPYLEMLVRAEAKVDYEHIASVKGKLSGHVSREGELRPCDIDAALRKFLPSEEANTIWESDEPMCPDHPDSKCIPHRESHCGGFDYNVILDSVEAAAAAAAVGGGGSGGGPPVMIGDPGCLVTVADRLHGKFALGSSISVAAGFAHSLAQDRQAEEEEGAGRGSASSSSEAQQQPSAVVALFGDSSCFHSCAPAICNAVNTAADITMICVDNGSAVTYGLQPHPGIGLDAFGELSVGPAVSYTELASGCGVGEANIFKVDIRGVHKYADQQALLQSVMEKAINYRDGPSFVHVQLQC